MRSQKLGFLRSLLCKWQSQATLIGKLVLPVLLLIRLVTLGSAVQTAWLDDDEFTCDTQQPGCTESCYDAFIPLVPTRLWTLQLVLVLAPGLVFLCYLIHLTNQENRVRREDDEVKGHALGVYIACMVSVILVEVGFLVAQSLLYGFSMNVYLLCGAPPCPHRVECTMPSAQQKTVYLLIMFTASCVSVVLSLVELGCVLLRFKPWLRQPDRAKALQSGSVVEQSQSFLSDLLNLWHSHAGLLGKTILPVLQLIRLVIVGAAVKPVWHNDLKNFVCNSAQPGCSQAAFSLVSAFSLHQYWTLQVVLVLAPGLVFFCYLVHLIIMRKKVNRQVLGAYLGLLSAVILLEVGFAVGQALGFGFSLSTTVIAVTSTCSYRINCYVSHATEKSLFMVIMFSVGCLSGLLTLVEMTVTKTEEGAEEGEAMAKTPEQKQPEHLGTADWLSCQEGGRLYRGQ
ncbi:uncharacterized protein LOC113127299 isoform X3 [Mastacembelus armatus]|uniref:uncharacterized protein LOC113127299 isoform X3 n=1 Tax=Mastacembelus armatus TaxID=205130 RepID=UPI000E46410C|nr:uncharacterized protein LOC113127299 isoform X3 [Mastacembelus armatus]